MRRLIIPLAAAALAAGLAACGGGGDSSSPTEAATQGPARTQTASQPSVAGQAAAQAKPKGAKVKLGSPAEVPRSKGGDNSIQDFGQEASTAERAAAARVLAAYLAAYASGDGGTACALLASSARQQLEHSFIPAGAKQGAPPMTCARILSELGTHLPPQARRQLTAARVLSLRVEGARAFAIYENADQKVYAAPLAKESGAWRVAALAGSPLL